MKIFLSALVTLLLTNACTRGPSANSGEPLTGKQLAQAKGCVACHSSNGQPGVGPTFKGLFGKIEFFMDGSSLKVDEAYLRESIQNPTAKIVRPFAAAMPVVPLTEAELSALIEYIKEQQ
jgi:cytochrome c oxidase subunit II